ncbi:MAG: hypothetical protein AB7N65_17600 [Vicinamibacterales bacterium]
MPLNVEDPDRWARLKELFSQALELAPERREEFVAQATGDAADLRIALLELLEAEPQADRLLEQSFLQPESIDAAAEDRLLGGRLGPYRVVERLAIGGYSRVYRGAREDGLFERPVALKLCDPQWHGHSMFERLRKEFTILAGLAHPNVVALHDAIHADERMCGVVDVPPLPSSVSV